MTPKLQHIIDQSLCENVFYGQRLPSQKFPIYGVGSTLVGFYAPKRRKGRQCMGFVYVAPRFRGNGFARKALQHFCQQHQGVLWFAASTNIAANKVAMHAGLTFIGQDTTRRGTWNVYEHLYPGEQTTIHLSQ